ncbi:MAG: ATP-binding protein, partial [Deltaproteobacteria bacterium]
VAWYATSSLRTFYLEKTRADLKARAILVAAIATNDLSPEKWSRLDSLAKKLGSGTSTRITVMLAPGKVIADSASDPSAMTDHSNRPEVRSALQGKVGHSTRHSYTLQRNMMYVAVPLKQNGRVVGVVRTSTPVTFLRHTLRGHYLEILGAVFIVALIAAGVSFLISRRLAGTIEEMKRGAERFAAGDLLYRIGGGPSEEMSGLAEAMNRMAEQLHERLLTITRQRNELEAMLSGMVEAVIVFDTDEHIIRLNRAAEKLFHVSAEEIRGRALQEAIRNSDLQRFVKRTLGGGGPEEGDLAIPGQTSRFLQAHGSIVRNGHDRLIGAVVVLNDVTRLKTLETIRKDFVANVSHELRTPVTTIKGFLETLREGAIDDPENAERFMNIAIKHTDRLSMIIEDLLSLSRIEEESEKGKILLEPGARRDVIKAVERECHDAAADKNITLESQCDDSVVVRINPTLFEQALVNLVDNALKYSEPGKTVQLNASRSNGDVVVEVRDQGCGIAEEHLPRIFERFYCVDKGRSREIGGTGLGLAIVKHIVIAHGGKISVESTPGKGTTFFIRLPEA